METPRDLLACWPSLEALSDDIGAKLATVRKWPQRGSIPGEYWYAIVMSAQARGIAGVTLEVLAAMHAKQLTDASADMVEARP